MSTSLLSELAARAAAEPKAIALTCGEDVLTLSQLLQAADRMAARLAIEALQPGDRVAIWMPPSLSYLIVLLAVWKTACIAVPIHEGFPETQADEMAHEVGARLLIVTQAGSVLFQHRASRNHSMPLPADAALVAFSSGTGGRAKPALHSHARMLRAWRATMQLLAMDADEVGLVTSLVAPSQVNWVLWPVLLAGGRVVISRAGEFWADFRQQRPTRIASMPGILKTLFDTAPDGLEPNPRLRSWVCAGDLPSSEFQRQFQARLGQSLGIAYGLVEAGPCSWTPVANGRRIGTLLPGVEARFEPDAGTDSGRLLLRTPWQMLGYWREGGELDTADCWLDTGDIVRIDGAGMLTHLSRDKDVLSFGGFKVIPGTVESVMESHPHIRRAALVGVPNGTDGVDCVLFWEGDDLPDAELRQWIQRYSHAWVRPDRMHRLVSWPTTRAGKLDRDSLRALDKQRATSL